MLKTKSNEITDTHQAPCEAPETAEALRRSMWQAWLRSLLQSRLAQESLSARWTGRRSIWCCSDCWAARSARC